MPPEAFLDLLKGVHLFRDLQDEQILAVARKLEAEIHPANSVIFKEGDRGDSFYIINKGQVKVTRRVRGEEQMVATLEAGDYFGEVALIRGRPRNATIISLEAVELLKLGKSDFDELLRQYPEVKLNLTVTRESQDLLRKHRFNWLSEGEVLYLVSRRHRFLLFRRLTLPALGALVLLLAGGGLVFMKFWPGFWVWVPLVLADLIVIAWQVVDWENDYFIVTNRRVVWLEKVVALYDSRQEVPLRTVDSVSVNTDQLGRMLDYGDVVIRTFTGSMTFTSVPHPNQVARLVEEHWHRIQSHEREAREEARRDAVRVRLGRKPKAERQPEAATEAHSKPLEEREPTPLGFLGRFLRVRFESGDVVTYRKHWFVLFLAVWRQNAILLALAGLVGLRLAGFLEQLSVLAVVLGAAVLALPVVVWWLYEFVDWQNDRYQVTPDQIVDLARKPLSSEERKTASLAHVLSLEHERRGLLGLLLNFGTVVINVGDVRFDFEDVFDPVGVQRDIYHRIEIQKARAERADAARRWEEMAEWLGVYHAVTHEDEEQEPPPAPTPNLEVGPTPDEEEISEEDTLYYDYP